MKEAAQVPEVRMMQPTGLGHEEADAVSPQTALLGRLGRRKLRGQGNACAWGGKHVYHLESLVTSRSALR